MYKFIMLPLSMASVLISVTLTIEPLVGKNSLPRGTGSSHIITK